MDVSRQQLYVTARDAANDSTLGVDSSSIYGNRKMPRREFMNFRGHVGFSNSESSPATLYFHMK